MKKNIFLMIVSLLTLTIFGCGKEITEEELKQFVMEYDDALSKGWSESDEIFVPWVTEKYLSKNAFLDHYSNKYWFIYEDDIEIINIEKIPKEEYELYGKKSYKITYRQKVIAEIKNNTIIPIEDIDNYGRKKVSVAPKNGRLYVTAYGYTSCWVKQKHLDTFIKRKGLVYSE